MRTAQQTPQQQHVARCQLFKRAISFRNLYIKLQSGRLRKIGSSTWKKNGWSVLRGQSGIRREQIVQKENRTSKLIERERLQEKWKAYTIEKRRDHIGKKRNSQSEKKGYQMQWGNKWEQVWTRMTSGKRRKDWQLESWIGGWQQRCVLWAWMLWWRKRGKLEKNPQHLCWFLKIPLLWNWVKCNCCPYLLTGHIKWQWTTRPNIDETDMGETQRR